MRRHICVESIYSLWKTSEIRIYNSITTTNLWVHFLLFIFFYTRAYSKSVYLIPQCVYMEHSLYTHRLLFTIGWQKRKLLAKIKEQKTQCNLIQHKGILKIYFSLQSTSKVYKWSNRCIKAPEHLAVIHINEIPLTSVQFLKSHLKLKKKKICIYIMSSVTDGINDILQSIYTNGNLFHSIAVTTIQFIIIFRIYRVRKSKCFREFVLLFKNHGRHDILRGNSINIKLSDRKCVFKIQNRIDYYDMPYYKSWRYWKTFLLHITSIIIISLPFPKRKAFFFIYLCNHILSITVFFFYWSLPPKYIFLQKCNANIKRYVGVPFLI